MLAKHKKEERKQKGEDGCHSFYFLKQMILSVIALLIKGEISDHCLVITETAKLQRHLKDHCRKTFF